MALVEIDQPTGGKSSSEIRISLAENDFCVMAKRKTFPVMCMQMVVLRAYLVVLLGQN